MRHKDHLRRLITLLLALGLIPVIQMSSTATVMAQDDQADAACADLNPAPLVVGEQGRVSPGDANNVRSEPSVSGQRIGSLPGGAEFTVVDGPACSGGYVWWQIDYNGLVGWTIDGANGEQFLFPADAAPADAVPMLSAAPEPPFVLTTNVITRENVTQIRPVREIICEEKPDMSRIIALSPNQRYIALDCQNDIAVYDLAEDRLMAILRSEEYAYAMQFAADNTELLTQTYPDRGGGKVLFQRWDLTTGEQVDSWEADGDWDVTFMPDHSGVIVQQAEAFTLIDVDSYDVISTVDSREEFVFGPWNTDQEGSQLAALTSARDAVGTIWDIKANQVVTTFETPFYTAVLPASLIFSPSGRYVVVGGCQVWIGDGFFCGSPEIHWYNAMSGALASRWKVPETHPGGNNMTEVKDMVFSPDGELLLAAGRSSVFIYDVDSGELIHEIETRNHDLEFSADGTFFVTAGDLERVIVWAVP